MLMTPRSVSLRFEAMAAEHVERMGRRIREQREALGLSRDELARKMGDATNGNAIYRWEKGTVRPGAEKLELLAKALGVPVAHFMVEAPEGAPEGAPYDDSQADRMEAKLNALLEGVALIANAVGVSPPGLAWLDDLVAEVAASGEYPEPAEGSAHRAAG